MPQTFPAPSRSEWTALAEKALKGAPLSSLTRTDADGLQVAPLRSADDAVEPLSAPRAFDADGRAWDLRTLVEGDDPEAVNAAILADLEGGAASVIVSGAVTADSEVLSRALNGVALELAAVGLDAGIDGPDAANALAVAAKGSPRARLMFNLDPIGAWARAGGAPRPVAEHLSLAANTAARHVGAYPLATTFLADGRAAHEAGGSIGQELGFAAAAATAHARAALDAGMTLDQAFATQTLCVAVDAAYFDGLAKVRALRLIWASLTRPCGLDLPARIEVRSSRRMLAATDPWPNLLRLTAAGFAGAVGGADAVVLDGFSRARGRPDAFARRQARNTQLVLMEEAGLGRVDDPAAGSWHLDARTRQLAEAGWAEFQRIEAEGGLVASLKVGAVQARIAAARDVLVARAADGGAVMVGVTKFVDPDPRPAPVEASAAPPSSALDHPCAPLSLVRLAAPAEAAA